MFIRIKVFPGAKRQEIIKKRKDSFDIKVKAKPKQGKANEEMIETLADHFNVPEDRVRIIRGFKWRNKIVEILDF